MTEEKKCEECKEKEIVPLTDKEKILKMFDDMVKGYEEYIKKFEDHLGAMDAEKSKCEDGMKEVQSKLTEIKTLREYCKKKLK